MNGTTPQWLTAQDNIDDLMNLFAYSYWIDVGYCPHCQSGDFEIVMDDNGGYCECLQCGKKSHLQEYCDCDESALDEYLAEWDAADRERYE